MFKQLTAIFLFAAFVAQTFSGYFIRLDYYTNTAAYAKNCINKARPAMHCNGKCQAMKKMQQQEKKEQQNPERKETNKAVVLSSKSFFYSDISIAIAFLAKATAAQKNEPLADRAYAFFHPPQA